MHHALLGHRPELARPLEAKRRMGLTKKTDKLDDAGLAVLLRNGTPPEVWIPPSELALVEHKRHGGFGPPREALRGVAKLGLSTGSRLAEQVQVEGASPVGTERRLAMKTLFGIVIFALALSTMAGCAARGFGRFGPPPPPPPPREAMVERFHAGRVWVPGYYRWTGHRYRWVEGRWVKPPRHGQVWVPGYRAPRRGGYVWVEGYWR